MEKVECPFLISHFYFDSPFLLHPNSGDYKQQSDKGGEINGFANDIVYKYQRQKGRQENEITGFCIVVAQLHGFHPKNISNAKFEKSDVNGCRQSFE